MASLRRVWLCVLLGACGDPLVGGGYLGEPRYHFPAEISGVSPVLDPAEPRVAAGLFWSPGGAAVTNAAELVEQRSETRHLPAPFAFAFELRDIPSAELLHRTPGGARWGVARLLAYDDANGDRRRDPGERLVGQAPGRVLLYAPEPVSAEESPTGLPLKAGFSLSSLPLACRPVPRSEAGEDCGVPLGDACESDADCGTGQCTSNVESPWPEDACTLPHDPDGCRPADAALLRSRSGERWVQGCETDADCTLQRPFQCDVRLLGCVPTHGARIQLGAEIVIQPVCRGEGPPPPGPPPP